MNNILLLEIFDKLEFEQLISAADVNYRFRELIAQHYIIPKYHFDEEIIEFKKTIHPGKNIEIGFDDSIKIHKHKLTLKIVRSFGHLISRINLDLFSFSDEWLHTTSSYINEYCSESLKEFNVSNFHEDIFLKWKKPFKNVNTIRFADGLWDCEKNNLNISEIFPSLQSLSLIRMECSSSKCVDYHFPNLKHIQLPMYTVYPFEISKMYENIFDLNPQLRSIGIWHMDNYTVLREANEKLNNLESIELVCSNRWPNISSSTFNGEAIRFKNVERLLISLGEHNRDERHFIPLEFDQLEEFEFVWPSRYLFANEWVEFIKRQQKLKSITILCKWTGLNLQQWKSIIETLPQLEVINTQWYSYQGSDGIAGVMAMETKVKKFIFHRMIDNEYNSLKKIIGEDWQIEGTEQRYMEKVTFIRQENYSSESI